jgi:hypothetical protein
MTFSDMPTNIEVIGTKAVPLSPEQTVRIKAFLSTVGTKNLPSKIVVVPKDRFPATVEAFGMQPFDTQFAFTTAANAVYVSSEVFDSKQHRNEHYNGPYLPEFIIGHEVAHMNDSQSRKFQAEQERKTAESGFPNPYDQISLQYLTTWQQNAGPAYSALKRQAPAAAGTVEPQETPAPELADESPGRLSTLSVRDLSTNPEPSYDTTLDGRWSGPVHNRCWRAVRSSSAR